MTRALPAACAEGDRRRRRCRLPWPVQGSIVLNRLLVVLVVLWLLGIATSYTLGGLIHVLLAVAIILVVPAGHPGPESAARVAVSVPARAGEAGIARDAAALKASALERIVLLEDDDAAIRRLSDCPAADPPEELLDRRAARTDALTAWNEAARNRAGGDRRSPA